MQLHVEKKKAKKVKEANSKSLKHLFGKHSG